ncbi:MAG TPA: DUF883 family protein [Eoetvoesiella sp.]
MNKDRHRMNIYRQKDRVAFDLKDLLAGTEELLRSTASYTGAEVDDARSKLQHQLKMAREAAGGWNQQTIARYRQASATTDQYVHERPWAFIGVALVIGAMLGHYLQGGKPWR